MSALLKAAVSAAIELNAPKCPDCKGHGEFAGPDGEGWYKCSTCQATGISVNDPEQLGRAAFGWLRLRGELIPEPPRSGLNGSIIFVKGHSRITESHDGTIESVALGLLLLVPRVKELG